jgi:hypothetical protein
MIHVTIQPVYELYFNSVMIIRICKTNYFLVPLYPLLFVPYFFKERIKQFKLT